jgi:hypothetical protein
LYFSENNDDGSSDLEDFVKFVGAHQQLKLFQEQPMDESMTSSLYRSKQQLSHFQNLRDTHASLSESITSSQHQETGISPVSSTSSAGGRSSYQPVVPSPLHTAEAKKPMTPSNPMMPRSYPQTRTLASTSKALRDARRSMHSPLDIRSLKGDSEDEDVDDDDDQDSYHTRDISAYSTYPTDRHYDMHHMRSGTSTQQGSSRQSHKSGSSSTADSDAEKSSNIGDKKGNDGKKKKKITLESRIAAPMDIQQQKRSNNNNNNSSSMLDDDDSLVFKMSELGYDDSPVGSTTTEPLIFNRAVASDNKNKKKEEDTGSPLTQSRLLFDAW